RPDLGGPHGARVPGDRAKGSFPRARVDGRDPRRGGLLALRARLSDAHAGSAARVLRAIAPDWPRALESQLRRDRGGARRPPRGRHPVPPGLSARAPSLVGDDRLRPSPGRGDGRDALLSEPAERAGVRGAGPRVLRAARGGGTLLRATPSAGGARP